MFSMHHILFSRIISISMNLLLNSKDCLISQLLVLEHCKSISFYLKNQSRGDSQKFSFYKILP